MRLKDVRDLISEINFYELNGKYSLADNLTEKLVKLSYEAQVGDLTSAGHDQSGSELAKRTITMDVINNFIRTVPECNALQGGVFSAGNALERAMAKADQENINISDAMQKIREEDMNNDPTKSSDPNYIACMNALSAKRRELQNMSSKNNQSVTMNTPSQALQTPHAPNMLQ